ncbi:hypothetical protein CYLTODRAFT_421431 [Cylindrobasidium torrendii FP15055 ss-10]|uniref:Uncharacterized protein n=1 Tax=Cylindrobasidium torrendii FP15055 ss-10 TaxID=1314674 RepID=A0A0D7BEZ0_9AGAR|nr:hypothetical protein CYLTODRAFT_421431 [Cylindrobasidium torrendii FP15055 ss-10]
MDHREFRNSMGEDMNVLHLDPRLFEDFSIVGLCLRPDETCLATLLELFRYNLNANCPWATRRHYSSIPSLRTAFHVLRPNGRCKRTLYLRHPLTGTITSHAYPYSSLPRFRLRTAHPVITMLHADVQASTFPRSSLSSDILRQIADYCQSMRSNFLQRRMTCAPDCATTIPCTNNSPAVSRKRKFDPYDQDMPITKRAHKTSPPRPHRSQNPLRKRKAQ